MEPLIYKIACLHRFRRTLTCADPENVKPGGVNSMNYQTEAGGANLFFGLTYKGEQGGVRRVRPPLNPRLINPNLNHLTY